MLYNRRATPRTHKFVDCIGFTLIELLIIASLIGISSLTVFTYISNLQARKTLELHTQQLINTIQYAKNLSITSKNSLTHGVDLSAHQYQIVTQNKDGEIQTLKVYQLPTSLNLTYSPNSSNLIWFKKNSGSTTQTINIILENSQYQSSIQINEAGQVNFNHVIHK